jgi:hypothetical protein
VEVNAIRESSIDDPGRGNPGQLVLRQHQEIVIAAGEAPTDVPGSYSFPWPVEDSLLAGLRERFGMTLGCGCVVTRPTMRMCHEI